MTLYIIIPVKYLAESKSRLSPVLADGERQALALGLLHGVLGVVQQAQHHLGAAGIVVSPDPIVLAMAVTYGLTPLKETPAACRRPITDHRLPITPSPHSTPRSNKPRPGLPAAAQPRY